MGQQNSPSYKQINVCLSQAEIDHKNREKHGYSAGPNFRTHKKRKKLDCIGCSILKLIMKTSVCT